MDVVTGARVVEFAQLKHGSLFLADLGGRGVRAIKALWKPRPSAFSDDCLVTIGPFISEDQGAPGVYHPRVLQARAVLDLTDTYRFVPSLDPSDLVTPVPVRRQTRGMVHLFKTRALVCVTSFGDGNAWTVDYLDVGSGELLQEPDGPDLFVTKHWSLVQSDKEFRIAFDYTAPLTERT